MDARLARVITNGKNIVVVCNNDICVGPMFREVLTRQLKQPIATKIYSAGCRSEAIESKPIAAAWEVLSPETGIHFGFDRGQHIDTLAANNVGLYLAMSLDVQNALKERGVPVEEILLVNDPLGIFSPEMVPSAQRLDAFRSCFEQICITIDTLLDQEVGTAAMRCRELGRRA